MKDIGFLVSELAKLTGRAIEEAKEKSIEPEMLNAIRKNIIFFYKYCDSITYLDGAEWQQLFAQE